MVNRHIYLFYRLSGLPCRIVGACVSRHAEWLRSIALCQVQAACKTPGLLLTQPAPATVWLIGAIGRPERAVGLGANPEVARRSCIVFGVVACRCRADSSVRWVGCGQCSGHKVAPDSRRQLTTADLPHRRLIVIANPDTHNQRLGEPYEPRVAVVLAGAGLARSEFPEVGFTTGPALDDQSQQTDQVLLIVGAYRSWVAWEAPTRKARGWPSAWNDTIPHGSIGAVPARTEA